MNVRLSDLLEAGNGVWAIVTFWLSIFLIYHIGIVRLQRRVKWRRFFTGLPLSMQIAVGMLAAASAVCLTRFVVWFARWRGGGPVEMAMLETWFFLGGIGLGVVGFLCVLRAVSFPAFGHWPWVGALASMAIYLVWWGSRFF